MLKWFSMAILAAVSALPVSASSVLKVDFDQLSRMARHVVSGQVTAVEAEEAANGYIYSTVTIDVQRAAPAQLQGREYTFRMLGGETSKGRLMIQGMPRFEVGDRVALFLSSKPSAVFGPTVGLWQGVFFVETNPATGQDVILTSERQPVMSVRENRLVRGRPLPKGDLGLKALSAEGGVSALTADRFFEEVRLRRGE